MVYHSLGVNMHSKLMHSKVMHKLLVILLRVLYIVLKYGITARFKYYILLLVEKGLIRS